MTSRQPRVVFLDAATYGDLSLNQFAKRWDCTVKFIHKCFCGLKRPFMTRVIFPPPLWGRAGWGVSPAGRGYPKPSFGAANPIPEMPGRIKTAWSVSLGTFEQLISQFLAIECAHHL